MDKIAIKVAFDDGMGISIYNIQLLKNEVDGIDKCREKIRDILGLSELTEVELMVYDGKVKTKLINNQELQKALKKIPLCLHVSCTHTKVNGVTDADSKEDRASPIAATSHVTHHSVLCDNCHNIVIGNRYKCLECIDYDLCANCFNDNCHSNSHSVLVIRSNVISPIVHKMLYQCQKEIVRENNIFHHSPPKTATNEVHSLLTNGNIDKNGSKPKDISYVRSRRFSNIHDYYQDTSKFKNVNSSILHSIFN